MNNAEFLEVAPGLVENYEPNDEVRQRIARVDFVPIVAPSKVGKNSVIDDSGLKYVTIETTRAARRFEEEGQEAHFRTDFDKIVEQLRAGEFVQAVITQEDNLYGTLASSYPEEGLCVMPFVAKALPVVRALGFRSVQPVFIAAPSFDAWMERYDNDEDADMTNKDVRLLEGKQSLELSLADPAMRFVLNDEEPAIAAVDLRAVLGRNYSHADAYSPEKEALARQAAEAMLAGLNAYLAQQK